VAHQTFVTYAGPTDRSCFYIQDSQQLEPYVVTVGRIITARARHVRKPWLAVWFS
jgi:hypothetical protein